MYAEAARAPPSGSSKQAEEKEEKEEEDVEKKMQKGFAQAGKCLPASPSGALSAPRVMRGDRAASSTEHEIDVSMLKRTDVPIRFYSKVRLVARVRAIQRTLQTRI